MNVDKAKNHPDLSLATWFDGKPGTVVVGQKSELWPNQQTEAIVDDLAKIYTIPIYFFKEPRAPDSLNLSQQESDFSAIQFSTDTELHWHLVHKRLTIAGVMVYPKELWRRTGKILAIPDLMGAQAVIVISHPTTVLPKELQARQNKDMRALRQKLRARTLVLTLADGIIFPLGFMEARTESGWYLVSAVFPKDEETFWKIVDDTK